MDEQGQARSTFQLMVLAAWADGEMAAAEVLVTDEIIGRAPELHQLDGKQDLARQAKERLDEEGLDAALAKAADGLTDRTHRELAFVYCARVLEADGEIAQEEFRVLTVLKRLFSLTEEDLARLLAEAARLSGESNWPPP